MKTKVKPARIRVALVEDDAALRELFKGWIQSAPDLELAGEFADAECAMDQLPSQPPDVVLMDINLPGSNGIECVRGLKPQMASTQFMMVTVYSDANLIFEALGAGATGYLLKRATRDELLAAIAEIARGGSPMSSTIARMIAQSFHRPAPAKDNLAPQEQRVLELMAQGFAHKEIAAELAIGVPTVGTYIRRIYDKLHVYTRAQAIAKFQGR
ncbi:MAG: response regulator transcription factor [Verrucomicrobiota bacterium]